MKALALIALLPTLAFAADLHQLPDRAQTPGAANPAITQSNIKNNICNHHHWSTKSERPPASFTTALKRQQLASRGYTNRKLADYEEDHLVPLEIGGAPRDAHNLWPQPRKGGIWNAHTKDRLELRLNKLVCNGTLTLAEAQDAIRTNWITAYQKYMGAGRALSRHHRHYRQKALSHSLARRHHHRVRRCR